LKIRLKKNLEPLRASALARLDALVAEKIADETPSAIAALRSAKAHEAMLVVISGGDADLAPLLQAESNALGVPLLDLAKEVLAKVAEANTDRIEIEVKRQRAQASIRIAPTPAAIDAALLELEPSR
jgi:CHASE3 domain sensor protein